MNILESIGTGELNDFELYGLYVIPESRLYQFKKSYNIFFTYSPTLPQNFQSMSHPDIPYLSEIDRQLASQASALATTFYNLEQNNRFLNTCGMVLMDAHSTKSMWYSDYVDTAKHVNYVFFTSKEKAISFLIDITKIFGCQYITEYSITGIQHTWLPAEIALITMTHKEVSDLSCHGVVAINPYVPAFF